MLYFTKEVRKELGRKKNQDLARTAFILVAAVLLFYLVLTGVAYTTKVSVYSDTGLAPTLESDSQTATLTISGLTYGDLAKKGFNYLTIELTITEYQVVNSTSGEVLEVHYWNTTTISLLSPTDSNVVLSIGTVSVDPETLKANATFYIDPVSFALWVANNKLEDENVVIQMKGNHNVSAVTVDELELYTVSKQTLLNALLQPIAPVLSGISGAIVAAWNRLKDWVWGAIGGAGLGGVFAGLIENPWVAAILAVAVILMFYYAFGKGKTRRRRR